MTIIKLTNIYLTITINVIILSSSLLLRSSIVLIHTQQVIRGRAMIINIIIKAFGYVRSREPIFFNLSDDLLIDLKVIITMRFLIQFPKGGSSSPTLPYKVFILNIIFINDLFF